MTKPTDEWQTPQWLFDELNKEFNFDADACATKANTKCDKYFKDALNHAYWFDTKAVFMNPPYSNPKPFIEKAWFESQLRIVVCLLKVDTSTQWWSIFWDYQRHRARPGCEIRFLPKRVKFESTSLRGLKAQNTPNFVSAVIVMDRRNI